MEVGYYAGNRERLYKKLCPGELLAIFSGEDVWKTGDECYPFFTERNFVYLTGLRCKSAVLLAIKDADSSVQERLYILPPDAHAERWTGTRVKPHEAEAISGVKDIRFTTAFDSDFKALAYSGNYGRIYLDYTDSRRRMRIARRISSCTSCSANIRIFRSAMPTHCCANCA